MISSHQSVGWLVGQPVTIKLLVRRSVYSLVQASPDMVDVYLFWLKMMTLRSLVSSVSPARIGRWFSITSSDSLFAITIHVWVQRTLRDQDHWFDWLPTQFWTILEMRKSMRVWTSGATRSSGLWPSKGHSNHLFVGHSPIFRHTSNMSKYHVAGHLSHHIPTLYYTIFSYLLIGKMMINQQTNQWIPHVQTRKLDLFRPGGDSSLLRTGLVRPPLGAHSAGLGGADFGRHCHGSWMGWTFWLCARLKVGGNGESWGPFFLDIFWSSIIISWILMMYLIYPDMWMLWKVVFLMPTHLVHVTACYCVEFAGPDLRSSVLNEPFL